MKGLLDWNTVNYNYKLQGGCAHQLAAPLSYFYSEMPKEIINQQGIFLMAGEPF